MKKNEWLLKEAEQWKKGGKISEEFYQFLQEKYPTSAAWRNTSIFFIIATIFLGLAVLTFMASNWDIIPVYGRLILLFGATFSCYVIASMYRHKKLYSFLFDLAGLLLFGTSIFLIEQMFHIVTYNGYALLAWGAAATYYAFVHRSHLLGIFAGGLLLYSYGIEAIQFDRPFSFSIVGLVLLYGLMRTLHNQIVPLLFYIFLSGIVFVSLNHFEAPYVGLALTAPLVLLCSFLFQSRSYEHELGQRFTLWLLFIQLTVMIYSGLFHAAQDSSVSWLPTLVALLIGTLIYVWRIVGGTPFSYLPILFLLSFIGILFSQSLVSLLGSAEPLRWIFLILLLLIGFVRFMERDIEGLLLFSLSVFIFYIETTWGLINKSLFFLLGALLLFAIGFWWRKKGDNQHEEVV